MIFLWSAINVKGEEGASSNGAGSPARVSALIGQSGKLIEIWG
jgi:hypothetical protein